MSKLNAVFSLVHSMSKAEKRYFTLYTSLHNGSKDYLKLYAIIDNANEPESAREIYLAQKNKTLFDATCKYLYKTLLDCLLQFNTETDKTARLTNLFLKARILFERTLVDEGFTLLEKIKREAEQYEEFIIQLWASQMELFYLSHINLHTLTENQLVERQMKIAELLKYQKNVHLHTSLYESLRHRLLHKGVVRTKEQKAYLNDLVVAELNYNANPLADTFESEKTHLLFQSYYFISINDAKSALKTLLDLDRLMQSHEHLWLQRPVDYLSMMEGILESLLTIKKLTSIQPFLDRLNSLQFTSPHYDAMLQKILFVYTSATYINQGEFEKALDVRVKFEEKLFKKIAFLDLSKQAETYLYSAVIYFGLGDTSRAHRELNKVLLENKRYNWLPAYRTFRLLHLLIQYQLGNHDYIEYETRSLKRTYKQEFKKTYLVEKLVFRFLRLQPLPASRKGREMIWQKLEGDFDKIRYDKYELQLLRIFDFETWMKAKLLRKSFPDCLKERLNRETDNGL